MTSHTDCGGSICGSWSLCLEQSQQTAQETQAQVQETGCSRQRLFCLCRRTCRSTWTYSCSLSLWWQQHAPGMRAAIALLLQNLCSALPPWARGNRRGKGLGWGYLDHERRRATEENSEQQKMKVKFPGCAFFSSHLSGYSSNACLSFSHSGLFSPCGPPALLLHLLWTPNPSHLPNILQLHFIHLQSFLPQNFTIFPLPHKSQNISSQKGLIRIIESNSQILVCNSLCGS